MIQRSNSNSSMAASAPTSISSKLPSLSSDFPQLQPGFTLALTRQPKNPTVAAVCRRRQLRTSNAYTSASGEIFTSREEEPRKGGDVFVEALEREGVTAVFAYPGGACFEIYQALARSKTIRNVLPRHEQGGIFAASGYARSSGRPGVCLSTSGPGATNLVTGLADALFDSVPMVAITGQVARDLIGTDAFQETPTVEITKLITKHNYLVRDAGEIPRIVKEAFFIAASGRPGPVLIDVPADIQQQLTVPDWNQPLRLSGYRSRIEAKPPRTELLEQIVRLIFRSKKPVVYAGGGCLDSSSELRKFVELTGIPVTTTLMGLGSYPTSDEEHSLHMLGMYGTVYANYSIEHCDLLLAFGVRFDDRVTGKVEDFASRAKIIHIDIDSAEIGKNKHAHLSIHTDINLALRGLVSILQHRTATADLDFSPWRHELNEQRTKHPLRYNDTGDTIPPQYAVKVLSELTGGKAIITTGIGQHQMWAAQFYNHHEPRRWLTSAGFGAMGFGLPAAMGAAITRPGTVVVNVDCDGSLMMSVQELAAIWVENLPVKIMVLNNQHLGMAQTYLGRTNCSEIFPDMIKLAEACGIAGARVRKREDVRGAIQRMLETPGPYLLDIIVPHRDRV